MGQANILDPSTFSLWKIGTEKCVEAPQISLDMTLINGKRLQLVFPGLGLWCFLLQLPQLGPDDRLNDILKTSEDPSEWGEIFKQHLSIASKYIWAYIQSRRQVERYF